MTRLEWGAAAVAGAALAFAVGRWTDPVQVEERTVEVVRHAVVTVTRVRTETVKAVQVRVVEREVRTPDGTVTVDRTTDSRTDERVTTDSGTTVAEKTDARREATVTPRLPDWRVSGMVGTGWPLAPIYGAHVERRILGPVTVGGWGLSSGVVGLSIGVEF